MLRPNTQRAHNAIFWVWMVMVFDILSSVFEVLDSVFYADVTDTDLYYSQTSETALYSIFYLLYGLIGIGYLIVIVISAVKFIQWFRRAYFNLHQKVSGLSYAEERAAIAWFIPILNLYVPYRIMKELYIRMVELMNEYREKDYLYADLSKINIWWALWIITGLLETISFRIYRYDETDIASTYLSVIACILTIPLSVVTVGLIKKYSVYETELEDIDIQKRADEDEFANLIDLNKDNTIPLQ